MKTLGEIIKDYRTENNISLRDFGERCGISHSYIDKLEKGTDPRTGKPIEPTLDTVIRISKALGKTPEKIFEELGHIQPNPNATKIMQEVSEKVDKYIQEHPEKEDKAVFSTLLIRKLFDEGFVNDQGEIDEYALNLLKQAIKMDVMVSKKPSDTV